MEASFDKDLKSTYTPPPPPPSLPRLPWSRRLNLLNVVFLIFILAVIFSGIGLQGPGRSLDYGGNLIGFLKRFYPPDFTVLPAALSALLETLEIAVLATFFAIILSFVLALAAAQNLTPRWIVIPIRFLLNLIRTPPSLIWALFAVAIVGANALAGVIALTFYSTGYLGKFFSETFESLDLSVARGLRAIGAGRIQAFQYGLWPMAKPLIWSHAIWMLEYNIRSAAIIGYVGAGGLGLLLHTYQEYLQWDRFATVFLCILVVVTILDALGQSIRRKITHTSTSGNHFAVSE